MSHFRRFTFSLSALGFVSSLFSTLILSSGANAWSKPAREVSDEINWNEVSSIPMRALPGVDFDAWLRLLSESKIMIQKPLSTSELHTEFADILEKSRSVHDMYDRILALQARHGLPTQEAYVQLADTLSDARRQVRIDATLDLNERYSRMTLLEFLMEEVLYSMNLRYPGKMKEYLKTFDSVPVDIASQQGERSLRGIPVTTGDIVLSKFSGTGSSSFIALSTERPSIFSHSALVYLDPVTQELLSPESFIEDGVKIRSMQESYINESKTRMFVFRAKGSNVKERDQLLNRAAVGVSSFVKDMSSRVQDPRKQAAFAYNFSMNPKNSGEAFNCTETVMNAYARGGLTGHLNPYSEAIWGRFSPEYAPIIQEFLEMDADFFPSPGDLDVNPAYHLVGFRLDVEKLSQDRIEMAAIDALFTMVTRNHQQIRESLKAFDSIGERKITAEEIAYLKETELIPLQIRERISSEVPANINIKQLIFFGYLNQVFTPSIRKAMQNDVDMIWASEKRAPGLNELRAIAARHASGHVSLLKSIATGFTQVR